MWLFDPYYLLWIAPAVLLGMWAQFKVKATYAAAMREPARMSGARAARAILDSAGLHHVRIEQVGGTLADHYDPREKVLRLSPDVFNRNSLASVGIAAHEAGHAIQDARNYAPLAIRNAAVPVANFGSSLGLGLAFIGLVFTSLQPLLWIGIVLFAGVVFFQLVNLPVEFNASTRAKAQLASLGIVSPQEIGPVNKVLDAAALTYVAATLQSVLTLLYLISRARD